MRVRVTLGRGHEGLPLQAELARHDGVRAAWLVRLRVRVRVRVRVRFSPEPPRESEMITRSVRTPGPSSSTWLRPGSVVRIKAKG